MGFSRIKINHFKVHEVYECVCTLVEYAKWKIHKSSWMGEGEGWLLFKHAHPIYYTIHSIAHTYPSAHYTYVICIIAHKKVSSWRFTACRMWKVCETLQQIVHSQVNALRTKEKKTQQNRYCTIVKSERNATWMRYIDTDRACSALCMYETIQLLLRLMRFYEFYYRIARM